MNEHDRDLKYEVELLKEIIDYLEQAEKHLHQAMLTAKTLYEHDKRYNDWIYCLTHSLWKFILYVKRSIEEARSVRLEMMYEQEE